MVTFGSADVKAMVFTCVIASNVTQLNRFEAPPIRELSTTQRLVYDTDANFVIILIPSYFPHLVRKS